MFLRVLALSVVLLAACAPELNWREVRVTESGMQAMFPCKPEHYARDITLAGVRAVMTMSSCKTGEATYAVAHVDVGDPGRVLSALEELRASAVRNLDGVAQRVGDLNVPGMTPNARAERWALKGRGVDHELVVEQAGFFSRGSRVYHAAVLGRELDPNAVETFFGGLRLGL